jgi:ABC-type multidrug transport system permease subunit
MRGLKRIAMSGRAVCATIHQPSIAIFNSFDALLLLKRGGETVFYGELGHESSNLIDYLEQYESTPKIQPGENPATWMLTTIGAGSASTDTKPFDYAGSYQVSDLHKVGLERIEAIKSNVSEDGKVSFPSMYATSTSTQIRETMIRARKIYWRSPSYNTVRLMMAAVLALLIGSVYVSDRVPEDESDMSSRATTIFVSFLFMGVNSLNTVLAIFETERNMYYRHKAALMYDKMAISAAFTVAELPFIFLASSIFVSIFYYMMGFAADAAKFFLFYFFFFMTMGSFTFLGQMFVALNRDAQTAQGFGGLVVTLTSLFTGVLIRPENIPQFWSWLYWVMPGHYIFEGLIVSQFDNDKTPITASPGTPFWQFLACDDQIEATCVGTAEQWVFASFGGNFVPEHIPGNIIYLVILLVMTRIITALALAYLNHRRT